MNNLKLPLRFLLRDWRSGELWLLVLSLLMAVSVSTAIALFSERLQLALGRQVAEVMGADMMIRSPRLLSDTVKQSIAEADLEQATVLEFPSVVMAGEEMQLVSAKAVTNNYPLRGHLRIADQPFAADRQSQETPAPGEAWLEPRLFPLLGVDIGDTVQLGETELVITKAITLETDRGSTFYSLSPRLMFSLKDLEKTNVIQPGSRVKWKTLLAGDKAQLDRFRNNTEQKLAPSERLSMAEGDREDLRNSVVRLKQFLGLGSMAAILLAGIAVAMSSRRFAERRFDAIAVMRCLGARQNQVMGLLIGELLLVAVLVAVPGVALGWLLQAGAVKLLAGVLPAWLPQPGVMPMLLGGCTGVITLAGFGLAPLLRLQQVTPLRVLRRDLTPAPAATWAVYGFSLSAMILLLWYHTGQLMMTLGITLAGAAVLLLIMLTVRLYLNFAKKRLSQRAMPLYLRLGLKRLLHEQSNTSAQLIAFSLTFMAMAIVLLLRTDLLERWQQQLPEETPNYFALNIQPAEVESFRDFLSSNAIDSSQLYPIIRGRLTEINDRPAREAVPEDQKDHNSLNRELSLTWSAKLPEQNTLLEGEWWQPGDTAEVSVEMGIVEHLGVGIGDKLTFTISGQKVTAVVTSLRQAQWESFRPNFYMILPEQALKDLPATWLNSFYLSADERLVLNDLVTQFPTLTLLDLDAVIGQVQAMLQQSTLAVEAMLVALLLAGLLVLAASIESSLDERLHEGALIRSLGGSRKQLMTLQIGEFIALGGLSGLIAAIGTEFCSWWLNTRVFELPWQPVIWLWLALPAFGALLIGFAGWLGVRRVIRQSPMTVLNAT